MIFCKKRCLRYVAFSLLFVCCYAVNGQHLIHYQKAMDNSWADIRNIKNHHPANDIAKVKMSMLDIPHIAEVKDSLARAEYLKLSFDTQKELDTLCALLPLFSNLKAISLEGFSYFLDPANTLDTLTLPDNFYKLQHLTAVQFDRKSKIKVKNEIARLSTLPNLRYFILSASDSYDLPENIQELKNLEGIAFTYGENLAGIKLPPALLEIEIIASNGQPNLNNALKMIADPAKLKYLHIAYFDLDDAFQTVIRFPALQQLHLDGNNIQDLGAVLANFKHSKDLQHLEVVNGSIATMRDIYTFRNLQSLKISNNRDSLLIPESISKLTKLTDLDLSSNNMKTLPNGLYKLRNMQRLSLAYNKLTSLSEDLGSLSRLERLDLQQNRLVALPKSINKMRRLRSLYLSANPLVQLPEMTNLTKLATLHAAECNLKSLPVTIGAMQNLHDLHLEDNYIEKLPESITQLTNLKTLLLGRNLLNDLPPDIDLLSQLEQLSIHSNGIRELPASIGQLSKLRLLNISHNALTGLPETLGSLSNLRSLAAQNDEPINEAVYEHFQVAHRKERPQPRRMNAVQRLNSFPKNLQAWQHIESIDLAGNDFASYDILQSLFTIPNDGFSVHLKNAHIKSLPAVGWRHFLGKKLDLLGNAISELPAEMPEAPYLSALDLRRNNLPKLPKNQNSYAEKRSDLLLYFEQVNLLKEADLPQDGAMVAALVEKSNQYAVHDKDYVSSFELYQKALRIDSSLVLKLYHIRNLAELHYHTQHYKQAVDLFTQAIQQDTVGMRILNFIVPDYVYRAKSHLALKDSSSAIQDYVMLATRFDASYWPQAAMLYEQTAQPEKAKLAYQKAIKHYQNRIDDPQITKDEKELLMLCLLELYIVSNRFDVAAQYANTMENDLTKTDLLPIFAYLKAINDLASGKQTNFSMADVASTVSKRWGYDLVLDWLSYTKLTDNQTARIKDITSSMISKRLK